LDYLSKQGLKTQRSLLRPLSKVPWTKLFPKATEALTQLNYWMISK
jgi:hypothetical protein